MTAPLLPITGDPHADALLAESPLALLTGMLLDQQVPMEWAFKGPATIKARMGGEFDAESIAAMDAEEFIDLCKLKPAIHRFPAAMGGRIHELCVFLVEHYDGDAEAVWRGVRDAGDLYDRLRELPGFGAEKSKIFIAVLVKRFGIALEGWADAAQPFGDDKPRSVADVGSAESLSAVRQWKKAMKAEGKSKQA
ncbi:MAG: hypothetical protein JJLCMIEE_03389 [Acidimicrobiales bacterium]|nr:MAG: Fe-S cluster assembly protein HesB [Actinomycetota bacterium]MBV6510258.1 hypothetical protein [Acidimicrobiales bacterium]RIK04222.1 MAG: Fe-S cluster assembly protein HesB [Acidobacteriota bacterium]